MTYIDGYTGSHTYNIKTTDFLPLIKVISPTDDYKTYVYNDDTLFDIYFASVDYTNLFTETKTRVETIPCSDFIVSEHVSDLSSDEIEDLKKQMGEP